MEALNDVLVIVTCLFLSAFFSGSETALLRVRTHDLEQDLAHSHSPAPVAALSLLRSTSRLLVTILVGNNVVNLLAAALAASLAIRFVGKDAGVVLSTMIMTLLVLVFSEVLPKAFAARHPRQVVGVVALPLYLLHQLLRPVHLAFDRFVDPLVRRLGAGSEGEPMSSAEELLRLARSQAQAEAGVPTPASIIGGVARAAEMQTADIMVPRTEIFALPIETPPAELLEQLIAERYTRVPIYRDSIDNVLGIVHLKDLIETVRAGKESLQGILKPILRVPERKLILPLLADMQRAFAHVAVVKDAFGVTLGLVTQEDILEEIVGEIRDEFDREELLTIRALPEGSYQALGRIKVLDFNRETGWDVPAERGDTLSGLVFNELGRAPRKGDRVRVSDYEIVVVDISGARITEVRVAKRSENDDAEADPVAGVTSPGGAAV
ncbi:hemolysin family protein [Myxococcota bacterium]|nr:hemolysin family protein [Myxococcota bacterium]MCZ7618231.1 hemolysin family protein [Myxococcota bacterium]